MSNISIQMVNCIEGRRAWVSDKTLVALSNALGIEVYQLFSPGADSQKQDHSHLSSHLLLKLRQDMKADINADVDTHFERLFSINKKDKQ